MLKEEQLSQIILGADALQSEFNAISQRWETLCEQGEAIGDQMRFSSDTRSVLMDYRRGRLDMRFAEQVFIPQQRPIAVRQEQVVEALKASPLLSFAEIRAAHAPDVELQPDEQR